MTFLISCFVLLLSSLCLAQSPYDRALDAYYDDDIQKAHYLVKRLDARVFSDAPVLSSLVFLKRGEYKKASAVLPSSFLKSPFGDYGRMIQAHSLIEQDLVQDDLSLITEFSSPVSSVFLSKRMSFELARMYLDQRRYSVLEQRLESALRLPKEDLIYPKLMKLKIDAAVRRGRLPDALKAYGELIKSYPKADLDRKIWNYIQVSFPVKVLLSDAFKSPRDYLTYVEQLVDDELYDLAIPHLNAILDTSDTYYNRNQMRLLLALSYFNNGQYQESFDLFNQVREYEPTRFGRATSLYHLGVIFQEFNSPDYAFGMFKKLIEEYPKSEYAPSAYYYLLWDLRHYGPYLGYQKRYKDFKKMFSHTFFYKQLQWDLAWKDLRRKGTLDGLQETSMGLKSLIKEPSVYRWLSQFYVKHFKSLRNPNHIWIGVKRYPMSYRVYSELSRYVNDSEDSIAYRFRGRVDDVNRYYDRLVDLGFGALAIEEVRFLMQVFPEDRDLYLYSYAKLLFRFDRYKELLEVLEDRFYPTRHEASQVPSYLVSMFYPKAYWSSISKLSRKYRVDPYLVLAVLREMSKFDSDFVDLKQRRGLAGLRELVAGEVAFRLGRPWKGGESYEDTALMLQLCVKHLADLMVSFDGDPVKAVAAYHASPRVVHLWENKAKTDDTLDFYTHMAFRDTRDFTIRVMESYMMYKFLNQGSNR